MASNLEGSIDGRREDVPELRRRSDPRLSKILGLDMVVDGSERKMNPCERACCSNKCSNAPMLHLSLASETLGSRDHSFLDIITMMTVPP